MGSERQLSILVPIGCIINDLCHELCIIKGPSSFETESTTSQWVGFDQCFPLSNVTLLFLACLTSLSIRCIRRHFSTMQRVLHQFKLDRWVKPSFEKSNMGGKSPSKRAAAAKKKRRRSSSEDREKERVRKQKARDNETPDQRASRLESVRMHTTYARDNETPDQRESRLESVRMHASENRRNSFLHERNAQPLSIVHYHDTVSFFLQSFLLKTTALYLSNKPGF